MSFIVRYHSHIANYDVNEYCRLIQRYKRKKVFGYTHRLCNLSTSRLRDKFSRYFRGANDSSTEKMKRYFEKVRDDSFPKSLLVKIFQFMLQILLRTLGSWFWQAIWNKTFSEGRHERFRRCRDQRCLRLPKATNMAACRNVPEGILVDLGSGEATAASAAPTSTRTVLSSTTVDDVSSKLSSILSSGRKCPEDEDDPFGLLTTPRPTRPASSFRPVSTAKLISIDSPEARKPSTWSSLSSIQGPGGLLAFSPTATLDDSFSDVFLTTPPGMAADKETTDWHHLESEAAQAVASVAKMSSKKPRQNRFSLNFRQVTHIKHNKSLFKIFKREEKLLIWQFLSLLPFFGVKKVIILADFGSPNKAE